MINHTARPQGHDAANKNDYRMIAARLEKGPNGALLYASERPRGGCFDQGGADMGGPPSKALYERVRGEGQGAFQGVL